MSRRTIREEEPGIGKSSWKENKDTLLSLRALAESGDFEQYQSLLDPLSGGDSAIRFEIMNHCFGDRATALIIAAENGHNKFIEMLVTEGADVSIAPEGNYAHKLSFSKTKLMSFIKSRVSGNYLTNVIDKLKNREFTATNNPSFLKIPVDDSKTLLHYFAKKGDFEALKELQVTFAEAFSEAAKIRDSETGRSVLHYAVESGNRALVGWLIHSIEADRNAQDNEGNTAYHIAAAKGDEGLIEALELYNVNRTLTNNSGDRADQVEVVGLKGLAKENPLQLRYRPFFEVIETDHREAAEDLFLKNKKSVAQLGEIFLNEAVRCGAFKVFLLLATLSENPIPNTNQLINENINKIVVDRSLLQEAAQQGDVASVAHLLDLGADINQIAPQGWNALYFAVNRNKTDVVTLLLERGAEFDLSQSDVPDSSRPPPVRADRIGCASLGKRNCLKLRTNEIVRIVNTLKGLKERYLAYPEQLQVALKEIYEKQFDAFRKGLKLSEDMLGKDCKYEDVFKVAELTELLKQPVEYLEACFSALGEKLNAYIHEENDQWNTAITAGIAHFNALVSALAQLRSRIVILDQTDPKINILEQFDGQLKPHLQKLPHLEKSSETDSEKSGITEEKYNPEELIVIGKKINKKSKRHRQKKLLEIKEIGIQAEYKNKELVLQSLLHIPRIFTDFEKQEREAREGVQKKQRKKLKKCEKKFSQVRELQEQIEEKDPSEKIGDEIERVSAVLAKVKTDLHPEDSGSAVLASPQVLLQSKACLKQLSQDIKSIIPSLEEKKHVEAKRRIERAREARAAKEQAIKEQKERISATRAELKEKVSLIHEKLKNIPDLLGAGAIDEEKLDSLSKLQSRLDNEGLLSSIHIPENLLEGDDVDESELVELTGLVGAATECIDTYIGELQHSNYEQLLHLIQGPVERLNMALSALKVACAGDPEIDFSLELSDVAKVRDEIGCQIRGEECFILDKNKLNAILPARHGELCSEIRSLTTFVLKREGEVASGDADLKLLNNAIEKLNTSIANHGKVSEPDLLERIEKFRSKIIKESRGKSSLAKVPDRFEALVYNPDVLRERYTADRGEFVRLRICAGLLAQDVDQHRLDRGDQSPNAGRTRSGSLSQDIANPRLYGLIRHYREEILAKVKDKVDDGIYNGMHKRLSHMMCEVKGLSYYLVCSSGYTNLLRKLHKYLKKELKKSSWTFGTNKQALVTPDEPYLSKEIDEIKKEASGHLKKMGASEEALEDSLLCRGSMLFNSTTSSSSGSGEAVSVTVVESDRHAAEQSA